jgi:hypothetical protein
MEGQALETKSTAKGGGVEGKLDELITVIKEKSKEEVEVKVKVTNAEAMKTEQMSLNRGQIMGWR